MDERHPIQPVKGNGILSLLLAVSGIAALERGSNLNEAKDFVKAIYIVDLEHVSRFWDDWEGFEHFVTRETLGDGTRLDYINRTMYLLQIQRMIDENPDEFIKLGEPSNQLKEIIDCAKRWTLERGGAGEVPSSRELLYCVCTHDAELLKALQRSGLQLDKLRNAVEG